MLRNPPWAAPVAHSPIPQSEQGWMHSQTDFHQMDNTGERRPKRNKIRSAIWEYWVLEIACLAVSLSALAALVAVLHRYNGKPLKDWPWSISPNSFLAVFSTVVKTLALLPVAGCLGQLKWTWYARERRKPLMDFEAFDAASRGILGSLFLLLRLRFGHIASLGCIITILAIAIDPLTQMTLSQPTRSVVDRSATATVLRAQNYNVSTDMLIDNDVVAPPSSIIGAMLSGLYTPLDQQIPYPQPECTTGNCTWLNYESLGICQKTKNVTQERNDICSPCSGATNVSSCHFACRIQAIGLFNVSALRSPTTLANFSFGINSTDIATSLGYSEIEWPIADVLMNFRDDFNNSWVWSNASHYYYNGTTMYETVFYFCVQEFTTNMMNGKITTTVLKESSITKNRTLDAYEGAWGYSRTFAPQLTLWPESATEEREAYVVEPEAVASLSVSMYNFFRGGIGDYGTVLDSSELGKTVGVLVDQTRYVNLRRPNNYHQLPILMENTARAMSNDLKLHPVNGTRPIYHQGSAFFLASYLEVDWAWLSLLFLTVPSSILFLILTMNRRATTDTLVWKSNSLPVLRILGEKLKKELGQSERMSDMIYTAENTKVHLDTTSGRWELAG